MSEQTSNPIDQVQPRVPPPQHATRPSTIPPEVWAEIQEEVRELKAQDFHSREELLAFLKARGCEDLEAIVERFKAGGEI